MPKRKSGNVNGGTPDLDLGAARDTLDEIWVALGALLQTFDEAEGFLRRRGQLKREVENLEAEAANRRAILAEENAKLAKILDENRRRTVPSGDYRERGG